MTQETNEPKILRTHTIQKIFDMFPEKSKEMAMIMTRHGLHCVGCHASVFETLEQGILGHGFPEVTLEKLLRELNEATSLQIPLQTISLSEMAANKISEMLRAENKSGWGLRFALKKGGHGEYELSFRQTAQPEEVTRESHGIKIFIPNSDLPKVADTVVDYVETAEEAGFQINNPHEEPHHCDGSHSH